jgi:hypothetical protein
MPDSGDEFIPPDDPRFEGAQFLDDDARLWHVVRDSDHLRGVRWRWSVWREREAVEQDPATGHERAAVWDHDHCHFCYDTAFSERYDGDLREGWTASGPAGLPAADQQPEYHWVCPQCFERFREPFGWTVEDGNPRRAE